MKEKLRKVQFNRSNAKCKNYTIGDILSDKDGILKKRFGLFHCWGEVIRCDSETGKIYPETVAIVEEIDTGDVYKIDPNAIVFVNDVNE